MAEQAEELKEEIINTEEPAFTLDFSEMVDEETVVDEVVEDEVVEDEITNNEVIDETTDDESTETKEDVAEEINYDDYISPDDLEALKVEWAKENKGEGVEFANEQAKKINDLLASGVELTEEFFRYQDLDFDSLDLNNVEDAVGVIRESHKLKGYSEKQSERLINRSYSALVDYDEEYASDDDKIDYDNALLDISIDAKKEIDVLKAHQENLLLPKNVEAADAVDNSEQEALIKESQRVYSENAQSYLQNEFTSFDIEVNDEVSLTVEVDDENMQYVGELVTSPQRQASYFTDRYLQEDGTVDFSKFAREQYILDNLEEYQKELINQAIAIGKETIVKDELAPLEPTLGTQGKGSSVKTKNFGQQMQDIFRSDGW